MDRLFDTPARAALAPTGAILLGRHVTGGSKDMIGAVAGLLTLLSALVLGLLIWTLMFSTTSRSPG
jgi:hypothetical protein